MDITGISQSSASELNGPSGPESAGGLGQPPDIRSSLQNLVAAFQSGGDENEALKEFFDNIRENNPELWSQLEPLFVQINGGGDSKHIESASELSENEMEVVLRQMLEQGGMNGVAETLDLDKELPKNFFQSAFGQVLKGVGTAAATYFGGPLAGAAVQGLSAVAEGGDTKDVLSSVGTGALSSFGPLGNIASKALPRLLDGDIAGGLQSGAMGVGAQLLNPSS